jgi:MoxR-like ATPase
MPTTIPTTAARSCENCPSMLSADNVSGFFKKSIGAPMCARYGHVLGRPGLPAVGTSKIMSHYAGGCSSFGDVAPTAPASGTPGMNVSIGDPTIMRNGMPDESERQDVSSCTGCANYVSPDAVANEFGWYTGMCAATGNLLFSNKLAYVAKNCDWRRPGVPRRSTSGIFLTPVYDEAFAAADPIKSFILRGGAVVEPTEYISDIEVDPADTAENGIRAWRKIEDPNGSGNFTHLPIFDPDFFEPNERAKIPRTGDDEHPEWYADHAGAVYKVAVAWAEMDETPALWGEPGTGKTELFRHLAWLMCLPFERISITARSEVEDLIGKTLAADGSTFFQLGRIPKSWQKPCVLCLDEPNTGPDEVWQTIRPLTDNSKQLVLDQHDGQRVKRNDSCYFGMAMNPAWDFRNTGVAELADADGNRLAHVFMPMPPLEIEKHILKQRCEIVDDDGEVVYTLPDDDLDLVMKVAHDVRGLAEQGTVTFSWGIRPQIKVARSLRWFSPLDAYRFAIADSLDPEQQKSLLDVVRMYRPTV